MNAEQRKFTHAEPEQSGHMKSIRSYLTRSRKPDQDPKPVLGEAAVVRAEKSTNEPGPDLATLVAEADAARDGGQFARAARLYENAIACAPDRTDLLVQRANMLKDARQFAAAGQAYRDALAQRPDDGDIHLQLGHLLKTAGDRARAIASYARAADLLADPSAAIAELAALGEPAAEERMFFRRLAAGDLDRTASMALEIERMRATLDDMRAALPDIRARAAFPLSLYPLMRELHAVPAPPPGAPPVTLAVLVPLADDGFEHAFEAIEGLRAQAHERFTAFFIGRSRDLQEIISRVAALDQRFVWAERDADETTAAAERRVARACDADWVVALERGAVLDRQALAWIAAAAGAGASACIADAETGERRHGRLAFSEPRMRGPVDRWSILEANVAGETIAARRDVFLEAGAQTCDLDFASARALLAMEIACAGGAAHIPQPLVWTAPGTNGPQGKAHAVALARHLARHGRSAVKIEVGAMPDGPMRLRRDAGDAQAIIDIVIPTHDNSTDLEALIESLDALAAHPQALRYRLIANNSPAPARVALERLAADPRTRVIIADEPFNWSRLSNQGARAGEAPLILFANDDMRMLTTEWDAEVRGLLDDPRVGALGARLLYPDGSIQHAGILLGWRGGAIHDGLHAASDAPGPNQRWRVTREVSAVTGAFLATRRALFEQAGGFDEVRLAIGYSDVDYCLKLRSKGLAVLWTPHVSLTHYESKSRGLDHLTLATQARDANERHIMRDRWGAAMDVDPHVHPAFVDATLPFRQIAPVGIAEL